VVETTFKYSATPEENQTATRAWDAIQTCRQVYNHALSQEYKPAPEHNKPSYTTMQDKLPEWKDKWTKWKSVYSKTLQMAVRRIKNSKSVLDELEERGHEVGELKWKAPREYRSITYNQFGFDVDCNTGSTGHATVNFSEIGDFHLNYHRPLPTEQNQDAEIKEVILKKEKTGEWVVCIMVEHEPDYLELTDVDEIEPEDTVGIDLGITKLIHDSNGRTFAPLDEEQVREQIEKRHRDLSRKVHESENWNKARQKLAEAYEKLKNRRKDYREKLASWYTQAYDAVFLEDLDVGSMMQQNGNSRNIASMSWYELIQAFERHGEKNGCHIVKVPPEGTTKRCAKCGVESKKPLWVREHSCPSCGYETDRDHNSSIEVQRLGLEDLGVDFEREELFDDSGQSSNIGLGQSKYSGNRTSVETGIPEGACHRDELLSNSVVETESPNRKVGSPDLNGATAE
jgi:putative transposase